MNHPDQQLMGDAGDDLTEAIALIRKITPATQPWTETDFAQPGYCKGVDDAIAAILNAVVDGRLSRGSAPAPQPDNLAVEALTTQLEAYKHIAARLASQLDRVHYELPTGQDWSISRVLAAYEELNDC
jgi:hypothetical protein